jgi:hypothetical protein
MRVLYDPANPRNARLDTWVSRRGDSLTMVAIGLGLVVLGAVGLCCFDRRGEPLDVQRSRTGLRRTLRAERLVGHHATSIITGTKIVGVASGRDLCPRAHDGARRSDIVGGVVLPAPEANGLLLSTPAAVPSACPSRRSQAVTSGQPWR